MEVSGGHTDVPEVAGEQPPSALILNDGDLSYARIGFDEATLRALAAAAMDVGDPLTEAVCWNAAWQLVSRGQLAAADLATLIARRVGALPLPGVEVLLERAVGCADVYAPPSERAGIRERVAEAAARLAGQAAPGSPRQRALTAGFAAAAQSDGQLARLRGWLDGDGLPAGLVLTPGLAAASCSRWLPAGWPATPTWTRWPAWTRCRASSTGPPAAPCGPTRPTRRPRGPWPWPPTRTGGWHRRTPAGCGCRARTS